MVSVDGGAETFPLIVIDEQGGVADVALSSEKAYRKSFEHGALWCVHPDTARVLPYEKMPFGREPSFLKLEKRETFAVAVLRGTGRAEEPTARSQAREASDSRGASTGVIDHLVSIIRDRHLNMPEGSYTSYLFKEGASKIRKKTGEESVEVILSKDPEELVRESADLIYHLLVLLEFEGVSWPRVLEELTRRAG